MKPTYKAECLAIGAFLTYGACSGAARYIEEQRRKPFEEITLSQYIDKQYSYKLRIRAKLLGADCIGNFLDNRLEVRFGAAGGRSTRSSSTTITTR